MARQNCSVPSGASKSVTRAGAWPGWVRAWTCSPYKTVAVVAAGRAQAARARIQAAEATGPVKARHGAGDVAGDADAQRRGGHAAAAGAGEGLGGGQGAGGALGVGGQHLPHPQPAGRDRGGDGDGGALAGGGVAQGAGQAAGGGLLGVAGLAGAGDGRRRGAAGEDLAGGAVGVDAGGVLGVAFGLPAGREGRRRGEVGLDGGADRVDGVADGVEQVGEVDLDGGGRGGVGVEAEDAAPAAGEADHGAGVVVGDLVGGLPGVFEALEGIGADRLVDLGGDGGGLGGFEDAGVSRARTRAAAEPASRGVPGAAPAAVKSPRMSLLTVARSQRRSPGRRVTWAASMRDSSSRWAASHQLAFSAGGGQTLLWAAWPPSWVRAPQMTG